MVGANYGILGEVFVRTIGNCLAIAALLASGTWSSPAFAQVAQGVIARCGGSRGTAYRFLDNLTPGLRPGWAQDDYGGKTVLVRLGNEWDIQFSDALGSSGYRALGAKVMPLGYTGGRLNVGAFGGTFIDIYTFDFNTSEVIWTSHKNGTLFDKVGIYRATCSSMTPP